MNLKVAKSYLERSFSVIPLAPRSKTPLIKWTTFQDRLPAQEEIGFWFANKPFLNVALVTGKISNLVVLDVDSAEAEQRLQALGELPVTPTVKTSKGRHYYFRHPGVPIKTTTSVLPDVDVRADGGYITAPPSVHPSGTIYEWTHSLDDTPLADVPGWLLELLLPDVELRFVDPELVPSIQAQEFPVTEETIKIIRSALFSIPSGDYEMWRDIGMGLHQWTNGTDDGFTLWTEWSKQSHKYKEKDQHRRWNSFRPDRDHSITINTVLWHARQNGWQDLGDAAVPFEMIAPAEAVPPGTLTDQTMKELSLSFETYPQRPSKAQWIALRDMVSQLEAQADGKAQPLFYLCSLDPGVGKTQALIHFMNVLLRSPAHSDCGVLFLLGRLAEIQAICPKIGLKENEFAVLVSEQTNEINKRLNATGNPNVNEARVLFTTQQMLVSRIKQNGSFSKCREFYYKDKPRSVKAWDETCLPARPLTINVTTIEGMTNKSFKLAPKLYSMLDQLIHDIKEANDQGIVNVPDLTASEVDTYAIKEFFKEGSQSIYAASQDLYLLAGKDVTVRRAFGNTCVYYENILPDDLKPIVICDASGRVRQTYPHWSKGRGDLVELQRGPKDYSNMTLHIWPRAGSKNAWKADRDELIEGIVSTIHSQSDNETWLIFHHKDIPLLRKDGVVDALKIPELIKARVRQPQRLSFAHWGGDDARATNEFRDVRNIVLAGTLFFDEPTYEALGRLSLGLQPTERLPRGVLKQIKRGEHANLILQAVCRGAVRQSDGETCGQCDVYVIAANKHGIPEMLRDGSIFPGAKAEEWMPIKRKLTGKVKQAFDFVVTWTGQNPGEFLEYSRVRERIGVRDKGNFSRTILDYPGFLEELDRLGIERVLSRGPKPGGFRANAAPLKVFDKLVLELPC
jgi:hypothetical protein